MLRYDYDKMARMLLTGQHRHEFLDTVQQQSEQQQHMWKVAVHILLRELSFKVHNLLPKWSFTVHIVLPE